MRTGPEVLAIAWTTNATCTWIAPGRLHLSVIERKGVYTCADVILTRSLGGYGTYRLQVGSGLDALSPALVFGFFTYSSFSPQVANREIDFAEVSRWGIPADPEDAQFVVQPADAEGNIKRFSVGIMGESCRAAGL